MCKDGSIRFTCPGVLWKEPSVARFILGLDVQLHPQFLAWACYKAFVSNITAWLGTGEAVVHQAIVNRVRNGRSSSASRILFAHAVQFAQLKPSKFNVVR